MALPRSSEARHYYQAALQRYDDAQFLLNANRTTGAIYLAGYGVECMLKALILSSVPNRQRPGVLRLFRGSRAHEFDWLRARYYEMSGQMFPKPIARAFSLVNQWAVEWRYLSGTAKLADAQSFLRAVKDIMTWSDGRM